MAYAIETQRLTVRLGAFTALEDLTLQLNEGEFIALLGPNGAGKSTLLRVLLGLVRPTAGTARVLGKPPASVPASEIGYVPQVKTLDRSFPAVSCELVASGRTRRWPWRLGGCAHGMAEDALRAAGAAHLTHRSVSVLSSGELQRVYLARAMARQPRLILLDEPAAGVDVAGEADMHHVLEDYRRDTGATVLMVTHDLDTAFHHASCAILLNRRLITCGAPNAVLTDEHLRSAFGHSGHAHMMWRGGGGGGA